MTLSVILAGAFPAQELESNTWLQPIATVVNPFSSGQLLEKGNEVLARATASAARNEMVPGEQGATRQSSTKVQRALRIEPSSVLRGFRSSTDNNSVIGGVATTSGQAMIGLCCDSLRGATLKVWQSMVNCLSPLKVCELEDPCLGRS
jgi:hypothetical protein